ncbi:MAG: hypothetical protein GYA55_08195 [SAR324 cluster bacterium]|uniref:Uncharacterized protein n=1 Tax=SAR324 cluster bacterium TaxID=2024889 RepID=A0A7X9ILM0_9DELT|nr:hypothetical protein [SAR324 cluster bacterium]
MKKRIEMGSLFLPLAAAIGLSILALFALLGFGTGSALKHAQYFRNSLDSNCRAAAYEVINPQNLLGSDAEKSLFREQFQLLHTAERYHTTFRGNSIFTELTIQKMPKNFAINRNGENFVREIREGKNWKERISNNAEERGHFPASILDPVFNAGTFVGCYAQGELESSKLPLFSQIGKSTSHTVSASAAYWTRLRGVYDTILDGKSDYLYPGLTIGIAPEMTTNFGMEEFWDFNTLLPELAGAERGGFVFKPIKIGERCYIPSTEEGENLRARNQNDQKASFLRVSNIQRGRQIRNKIQRASFNIDFLSNTRDSHYAAYKHHLEGRDLEYGISETAWTNDDKALCPGSWELIYNYPAQTYTNTHPTFGPIASFPNINAGSYDNILSGKYDFENSPAINFQLALWNPPVKIRNRFLSTIVELASRHAHTRSSTGIFMINPVHEITEKEEITETKNSPRILYNFPAVIVNYGEDLTAHNYQIPYTWYRSENFKQPNDVKIENQIDLDEIFPFSKGSGSVTRKRYESLISSLPRSAVHLFARDKLPRLGEDFSSKYRYFDNSQGFLPDEYSWKQYLCYENVSPSASNLGYDQNDPWADQDSSFTTRRLKASEAVSALATIQKCPFETAMGISIDGSDQCKARAYEQDLHGDIGAMLRSWIDGGYQANRAIASPGLYPINSNASSLKVKSPLILVLHRPIFGKEEVEDIKSMIAQQKANQGPPIVIVYIPFLAEYANADESNENKNYVNAIAEIFQANLNAPDGPYGNVMINISPSAKADSAAVIPCPDKINKDVPSASDMRDFWNCMLNTTDFGIEDYARQIFFHTIMELERRY